MMEIKNVIYCNMCNDLENLLQRSKDDLVINNLFRILTSGENIKLAILNLRSDKMKYDEDFIKEIQRKLKHGNLENNNLKKKFKMYDDNFIRNVMDMCFYNVLEPIVEGKIPDSVYSGRPNISNKHAFARIANLAWKTKLPYKSIDVDIDLPYKNINHKILLDSIRNELNIKDPVFINKLKYLLLYKRNVGLNENGYLKDILLNVYLLKFDRIMNDNYIYFRKISRHGIRDFYKSDNKFENFSKVPIHYTRYNKSIKIITVSDKSIKIINEKISDMLNILKFSFKIKNGDIFNKNRIDFLDYSARRGPEGLIVSFNGYDNLINKLKTISKMDKRISNYSRWYANVISGYSKMDICPNVVHYTDYITSSLNIKHRGISKIPSIKMEGNEKHNMHWLIPSVRQGNDIRKNLILDPWKLREGTKVSISRYLTRVPYRKTYKIEENTDGWVNCDMYFENTLDQKYNSHILMFLPELLRKQKFKCYISGKILSPGMIHMHHVKPISKGGSDEIENIVIIEKSIHMKLHDKKFISCLTGLSKKRFDKLRKFL